MASSLVGRPEEVDRLRLARSLGVSPRRLLGWEPRTFQRGLDRDGNPCRIADAWEIVTEREPEWSDDDRAWLLALDRYERDLCACGAHRELADDKNNIFIPEWKTCSVCAGLDLVKRVKQAEDERVIKQLGEDAPAGAPRPWDGRRLELRIATPEEAERIRSERGSK